MIGSVFQTRRHESRANRAGRLENAGAFVSDRENPRDSRLSHKFDNLENIAQGLNIAAGVNVRFSMKRHDENAHEDPRQWAWLKMN